MLVKNAWDNVSSDAINNCFQHGFSGSVSIQQTVNASELSALLQNEAISIPHEMHPTEGGFFIQESEFLLKSQKHNCNISHSSIADELIDVDTDGHIEM